ncbi:TIGR02757 family protein [Taibaiella koreensis]|uniref:TIGR02757 family protein n=1 Tax=Taibaiella koreensis TaxID=1268548 RepID=UPI000E59B537|nr:TIGR02757 family protein [Taibaiella koreensis]
MNTTVLKQMLDRKVAEYDQPDFIAKDPVSIPHRFNRLQDIEISGFFAALFAWGNRTSIINSCNRLLQSMDNAPYDFVRNHTEADLKPLLTFVHRTFNATDLFWLLHFLRQHFHNHDTLETAFSQFINPLSPDITQAISGFHDYVFAASMAPERTRKHISTPAKQSACKRLNMFLRWMVRRNSAVDFGIWRKINPAQLVCPLDVHVARVARRLHLLSRKQDDWEAALELTAGLRQLDPTDPVRYDYALFGLGVIEKF